MLSPISSNISCFSLVIMYINNDQRKLPVMWYFSETAQFSGFHTICYKQAPSGYYLKCFERDVKHNTKKESNVNCRFKQSWFRQYPVIEFRRYNWHVSLFSIRLIVWLFRLRTNLPTRMLITWVYKCQILGLNTPWTDLFLFYHQHMTHTWLPEGNLTNVISQFITVIE